MREPFATWVDGQAYRLIVSGMTYQAAAQAISEMGQGLRPGRLVGVEYPSAYKISVPGVFKAFRRYCHRNPPPGLVEMRRIDTQRCEDIYRALLPTIARGGREGSMAANAAVRALARKARINGIEMPIKVAAVDAQGHDLVQIPLETVRKIMEGGEVVFDAEPDKQ